VDRHDDRRRFLRGRGEPALVELVERHCDVAGGAMFAVLIEQSERIYQRGAAGIIGMEGHFMSLCLNPAKRHADAAGAFHFGSDRNGACIGNGPHRKSAPGIGPGDVSDRMSSDRLERLTEKEREVLRLVPTHGTITAIARALTISDSAVKLRLSSATKKLGVVGRHDAARLLVEQEGWPPYPNRTAPIEQVEPSPGPGLVEDRQAPGDGVAAAGEEPFEEPSLGHLVSQIADRLSGKGGRNQLTIPQRLAFIFAVMILGLLLFSMLLATLTETGRYGRSLRTANHTSI
jgi:DNA-binding CsgD family transcriptional regulator